MIKYLKDEDFKVVIKDGVWIVDFYADWCGPCKMMGEVLEDFKEANILKVNTDEYNELALSFGIMSIPTLIKFNNGEEIDKRIGLQSRSDLEEFLK